MKTKFSLLLLGACTALASATAAPVTAGCCAAHEASDVAAAPLSSRSIYQLESQWTNDSGGRGGLAQLRGRPVVITMFFGSCSYACPLLVSDMQRLRELLPPASRDQAQFVLVSFDPVRDTPVALNAYRQQHALTANWTLLTGDQAAVQELAMILGVKFKQDANGQFSHSNLITVLNAEGEIIHQRTGLTGDVSEIAKAVALAAAP